MNTFDLAATANHWGSRWLRSVLLLAMGVSAATLAACGGGGGYSGDSGSGSMCGGAYGSACPPTSAGSPSVTLSVPNSTPNRTITLTATPTAPNGITRVEFMVDATVIGMATTAPYTVNWDTSTTTDGAHNVTAKVTDAMNLTASSAVATVTVANVVNFAIALNPNEEWPVPISTATGTGQVTVNLVSGAASGNFTLTGVTAIAAHIHDGYAGNNGGILYGFVANGTTVGRWDLPGGTVLTQPHVDKLLAGSLYVNVHSSAYTGGELRSQLKATGVQVIFASMSGAQETPAVTTTATGAAAVTVDGVARKVSVHLNSTGVDDATMAHIHKAAAGTPGPVIIPLTKDSVRLGHWSTEMRDLSAAEQTDLNANLWYSNIHTPAHTDGELRGQIVPNAPAPVTLTQLQTDIFTPRCASCHTGSGGTLPGSMNLTSAGASYAALVSVASLEQGTVLRVQPNNPANSYLIRKLEGTVGITGSRMPLGGPFLDTTTIDRVKSWINNGAPNN